MAINETSRPLLPGDEDQINSQFAKKHAALQTSTLNRRSVGPVGPVGVPLRSTSSRNMPELFDSDNLPMHRALTNTDNFIQMYNTVGNAGDVTDNPYLESDNDNDELTSCDEDQVTLGSEDNLSQPMEMAHGMLLDPSLKKHRQEWADRGAAKVVRDVTNPNTGQTTREVIRKGIKDFKFGETLGDGSYSTVMVATAKENGKKYAVKILSKEYLIRQKKVKYVNIEKNALQRLNNSRSVIKLYFTFQDESSLYFLLEYAPNGDFLSVMKKYGSLSEECTRYYAAQIIGAIKFLHTKGIIHRDIKPENILLDREMKVKLTDFGTAKLLEPKTNGHGSGESYDLLTRSKSFVGTAEYVSPELLNDNWVDYRCDIWAFGCILFQMIAGKPPFKATNEYLTFQKVMKVQYAFTAGFPLVIRDLVKRTLIKQPEQRLTIQQIERHHFFKEKNFKDGSVWDEPAPQIQPYRMTAKSMQPIPALNTNHYHTKRSWNVRPNGNKPSVNITSDNSSNITISSINTSASAVTSGHSQSKPSSPVIMQKKVMDDKTAQILDNAKRAVDNRKVNNHKKPSTGTSGLAYTKKKNHTPPTTSSNAVSSATPSTPHLRSKSSVTPKSTNNYSSPMISLSNNNSSNTLDSARQNSTSPVPSPVSTAPPLSKIKSNDSDEVPPMRKIDILWGYHLTNSDERVLGAGEVNFAVVDNNSFERRVYKSHGSLTESQRHGPSRATLLSQVARGGGGITGLRSDSGAVLLEPDFYKKRDVSNDDLVPEYRVLGGDTSLSPSDERERGTNPSEENPNSPISGKFRRFFYHGTKLEGLNEAADLGNYHKRMLVATTFGRVLVLAKRRRNIPNSTMNYDLCYDINVCQPGVKLKELSVPIVTGKSGNFVIQSPFDSFLFRTTKTSAENWLLTLHECIRVNHERLVSNSLREDSRKNTSSADAMKASKPATPDLTKEKDMHHSHTSPNPMSPPLNAPKTPKPSLYSLTSGGGSSGSLPGVGLGLSSRSGKNDRIFDSFVNSKEKHSKKRPTPVPITSKLVNGLPFHNYHTSVGLGITSHAQTPASPVQGNIKTNKKTINPGNSRLLARSEQTFRRKH